MKNLNGQEQTQLRKLLCEFEDVLAKREFDLGKFNAIQLGIDTGSNRPVKQRIRRTPLGFAGEEEAQLKKMLGAGVIRPSVSEWASAPVLIRKRCGSVRWCVDYWALNALTTKDVFPLPLVDERLDTLAENAWYSKLDANSAYWQVKINLRTAPKQHLLLNTGCLSSLEWLLGYVTHQPLKRESSTFGAEGFELESGSGFPGRYPGPGEGFRGALGQPKGCTG